MFKINRAAWLAGASTGLLVAGVLLAPKPQETQAFPKFTKNEGVPCAYCHVNPKGGGKRNYRGAYYDTHKLSFAGFDDKAEAKKAGEEVAPEADKTPKSLTPPVMTVADATAKAKTAEAAYKKAPKDPAMKKAYADALADQAHATMLDDNTPSPKRLVDALKVTQMVLKLDPDNKQAKEDKAACESAIKVDKERGKTAPPPRQIKRACVDGRFPPVLH